jgi:hypothetical protein
MSSVKTITVIVPEGSTIPRPNNPRNFYPAGERIVPKDSYHMKLIRKGLLLLPDTQDNKTIEVLPNKISHRRK